jgi:cytochrome c-type biogenesis protein CcmH
MTLWFLFALMTAAAIFAVLWPLGRGARQRRASGDVAVYRDQIDEIARDRAAGLIGEAEAEAARVEVSRRLIAAADADASEKPDAPAGGATFRRRAAAVATLVALPAIGAALYLTLGSPDVPGQPIARRAAAPAQNQSLETLVARVEAHLETNPEDGRGWEVIAPVYVRLGRIEDAVKARRNALRINKDDRRKPDLEAELGETLIAAANGVVTQEAKAAFERAAAQDARHPKARFFLGVAAHQDGEAARALAIWRDIARDTGTDSPWGIMARQGIASVEGAASAPGPSAEDVAASQQMDPQDRAAMIRGMVERLAERLKRDGSDVEGWLRLVRAYTVMGDRERALSAVADARRALGHDADKLRRIDALAKELKLES